MDIRKARQEISHGCDGPLTAPVLIHRAFDLVIHCQATAEVAADALTEELEERGMLIQGIVEVPGT